MKLYNDTKYNYRAIINDIEYDLRKGTNIEVEDKENTKVLLMCQGKSSVHINILDLLLGVFFGDSTVTMLYADYYFETEKSDSITIKCNDWNEREQFSVYACYADAGVTKESYEITNLEKIKKKHTLLHLFVTSLFPVGIILLLLCFILSPPYPFILLFAIWFFIFGLPSLKEIKRFKKETTNEYINQMLCERAVMRRNNENYDADTSKSSKFINGILKKMFKFDEEK